jgi:hypothetical protein
MLFFRGFGEDALLKKPEVKKTCDTVPLKHVKF